MVEGEGMNLCMVDGGRVRLFDLPEIQVSVMSMVVHLQKGSGWSAGRPDGIGEAIGGEC